MLEHSRNKIELDLKNHELVKIKDKEDEIVEELKSIVAEDKSKHKKKIIAKFEKLIQPNVLPE